MLLIITGVTAVIDTKLIKRISAHQRKTPVKQSSNSLTLLIQFLWGKQSCGDLKKTPCRLGAEACHVLVSAY